MALSVSAQTLDELRASAADCKACELWKCGTQTVFGEGSESASMMMVGEQPGDREDQAGRPFVGPAGRLLDEALELAGIDRQSVYLTNAVKHFRWKTMRGKRRIHQKPTMEHVRACNPWLEAELSIVQPEVLVCLGATAAAALFGPSFRVTHNRGRAIDSDLAPVVFATVHPSSVLRTRDEERRAAMKALVSDLALAGKAIAADAGTPAQGSNP